MSWFITFWQVNYLLHQKYKLDNLICLHKAGLSSSHGAVSSYHLGHMLQGRRRIAAFIKNKILCFLYSKIFTSYHHATGACEYFQLGPGHHPQQQSGSDRLEHVAPHADSSCLWGLGFLCFCAFQVFALTSMNTSNTIQLDKTSAMRTRRVPLMRWAPCYWTRSCSK